MKKVLFVYFLLLFALFFMAYFVREPFIPTDEQYYVNFARCFVGIKDHCVSKGVPFGFSLFLIPFVFIKDLQLQFSSMIFFNSFLISGIFFVAFYFFRKFQKRTLNSSIFLSLIITLLPSFFLAGKTVMTEPLFILVSGILFLLFYGLKEKDFSYKYFFIGSFSFLLFMVRLNGVIFLILSFLYILFFVFPKNKKALLFFLLGVLPLFVLKVIVENFVFENSVSLYGSTLSSLYGVVFSFSWLKNICAYFVYTSIASFFVIPLFLVDFFRKRKFETRTLLFISAFFLNILVVSILFENGDRFDHHFYGRYIDAFILPLMLVSFDYVFLGKKIEKLNILIVLLLFLFSFFLMNRVESFSELNVYSNFPLMFFFEKFAFEGFYYGVLFISAFSLFFYFTKYKFKTMFIVLLLFLSFSGFASYFFREPVSAIPSYLNEISAQNYTIFLDRFLYNEYLFSLYFLHFPNLKLYSDVKSLSDQKSGFLIASKDLVLKNAYLLIYENHQNLALYTFDIDLYNRLKNEKKVVFDEFLSQNISVDISKIFDFSFGKIRVVKFKVVNASDLPWVTYFPSRHSKHETHEISLREYCFDGDKIVGEKRRHFDSIIYPGGGQEFLFYTVSPVCSKITYDVVQEGYMGFNPVLEIDLK